MAEIVLGIGSSHTPQLSTSATHWSAHAARDEANPALLAADGEFHGYEELLAGADPRIEDELTEVAWEEKFGRAQAGIEALSGALAKAAPDVVVVVGDDQNELFGENDSPAIALFVGERLWDWPPEGDRLARIPPDIQLANWAAHAEQPDAYPVAADLSSHLARSLVAAEFDLTVLSEQPAGHGLGHAFTFVRRRLGLPGAVPIVPVLLNTYYPPNVPSPSRCYRLGQALRAAISSFGSGLRVAILASGGLSHFVVLEDLDRAVLEAIEEHDGERLSAIPSKFFRSGTSETLNWITAAGALEECRFDLIDYIPAYRSRAGTGCGMAFALWQSAEEPIRAEGAWNR